MTGTFAPRTLRLAAKSFDRFIAQKQGTLTDQECSELTDLADMLRAVARREADLLLSAFDPKVSPEAKPGTGRGLAAAPAHDPSCDDMCPNCVTPWKCNGPHVPADPSYPTDPDGGLARLAADEWVDARMYAEGMEPFARGEGNLS